MTCEKCGAISNDDSMFCTSCGAVLQPKDVEFAQPQPNTPATDAPPAPMMGNMAPPPSPAMNNNMGQPGAQPPVQPIQPGVQPPPPPPMGNMGQPGMQPPPAMGNMGQPPMGTPPYQPGMPPMQPAKPSSTPLVMGILGILIAFFIPIGGLALGIAGVGMYSKDKKMGKPVNPAGNVLSIIAIVAAAGNWLFNIIFGLSNLSSYL